MLDWELATLGDPLADFSYLAMQWMMPADGGAGLGGLDLAALGIPTLDEIVAALFGALGRARRATSSTGISPTISSASPASSRASRSA